MTITVSSTGGSMAIAGGVDFVVDWGDGAPEPGLAVLDKDSNEPTAKQLAYFPPGTWSGVVKK